MLRRLFASIAVVLLANPAVAAEEGLVEATGEAQIKNGDVVEAKRVATLDALQGCIEKVVGIYVASEFTSSMKETVKNNQNEFQAKVQENLVQKAEGFIESYDVLGEKTQGDVIKVSVRAHVFESKIKAELKELAELIAAAGNPKLMVIIQEIYVAEDGTQSIAQQPQLAAHIEKELIALGFELCGQKEAVQATATTVAAYDAWMGNLDAVSATAREAGAELLVLGRIEFKDIGKAKADDVGGLDSLVGMRMIEISGAVRAMNTASQEVFSTTPIKKKEFGTGFERALVRAFVGRGRNLMVMVFEPLLKDAKASLKKTVAVGQAYLVQLTGVKSFRKEGQGFLSLLEGLSGVSSARQKSFAGGVLMVDVLCKCSAEELQQRIFSSAEQLKAFVNLDVESVSGKHLSFKL
jgi:hypothetical protein